MSIVDDQIRRFDTYLDKCQVSLPTSRKSSVAEQDGIQVTATNEQDTKRAAHLKTLIRALSTTSSSRPLLKRRTLRNLVAEIQNAGSEVQAEDVDEEEHLEWLAAGKATIQLYGIILDSFLQQTIPLSESMWYWDDVLGSYSATSLYMLQTSPLRLIHSSKEVWREANARYQSNLTIRDAAEQSTQSLSEGWQQFYRLVRESIRDRSLAQARTRILSPFALSRTEARRKQEQLKKLREQSATAIGLLVDEGLSFPSEYEVAASNGDWRITITKSVSLLEGLLNHARDIEGTISDYEYNVIEAVDAEQTGDQPAQLAARLLHVLNAHLPEQEKCSADMAVEFGKPPRWIRYWIPGVIFLLSGGTLLRVFANRRAEITTWIQELGQTSIDFWYNWVVEPVKRLVGTIRHDSGAELAIQSRDSLKSDRESLERMVIDFAVENPEAGRVYTQAEIADIRSKVKEGDLTPVLRAYEQDMKSPIVKAVTGNLIRTLLIQIQKTKVDVEVAIGGIDSILKSQELLFGFVGVAPGILVTYFVGSWVRGFFGGRRGVREFKRKGESVRLLRNVDRILTDSVPTQEGLLSYKDHGLLICEVHILRQRVVSLLPGRIQREFLEDINDLMNVRTGIDRQRKVLHRIQWAYARWLK